VLVPAFLVGRYDVSCCHLHPSFLQNNQDIFDVSKLRVRSLCNAIIIHTRNMFIRLIALALALSSRVVAFTTAPVAYSARSQRILETSRHATLAPPPKQGKQEKTTLLENVELPDRLYLPAAKEMPKVLGGLKIGFRELVVVTGASSGLGLNCVVPLAKSGKYFVVMACRDVEKGKRGMYFDKLYYKCSTR
jgi:hypothetical protein